MRIRYLITLAALASTSIILLGCPYPMPSYDGEVEVHRHRDTLIVDYDVVYGPMDPDIYDSITLALYDSMPGDIGRKTDSPMYIPSVVYPIDSAVTKDQTARETPEFRFTGNLRLTGRLRYLLQGGKIPAAYSFDVYLKSHDRYWYSRGCDVYQKVFPFRRQPGAGLILGLGMANFDRSVFPREVRDKAYKFGIDFQIGLMAAVDNFTSRLSFAVSGFSSEDSTTNETRMTQYLDYVDFRLGYETKISGGLRFAPVIGAKFSRLNVSVSDRHYDLKEFRPTYGFQIGDKFNRLEYSYNPHFGGYHRLDYLACISSGRESKFGSMYSIFHGANVRMFFVQFYLETVGNRDTGVSYINNQPILQRIIATGLLAPLVLVVMGLIALGA